MAIQDYVVCMHLIQCFTIVFLVGRALLQQAIARLIARGFEVGLPSAALIVLIASGGIILPAAMSEKDLESVSYPEGGRIIFMICGTVAVACVLFL
jgi:hypothetical protein